MKWLQGLVVYNTSGKTVRHYTCPPIFIVPIEALGLYSNGCEYHKRLSGRRVCKQQSIKKDLT